MKRKKRILGIAVTAFTVALSVCCFTAFAASVDAPAETDAAAPQATETSPAQENADEEPAQEQSEYSYLAGQRRSDERNELYAQAEELPEDERDAFLAENGVGETPWFEEAAASYSYVGGRQRGASFRQSDDGERTQDTSDYGYLTGQQRGASYQR